MHKEALGLSTHEAAHLRFPISNENLCERVSLGESVHRRIPLVPIIELTKIDVNLCEELRMAVLRELPFMVGERIQPFKVFMRSFSPGRCRPAFW